MLLGIGFLAGLITALSPCALPVLPIVLAGGASGGGRRPYAIVAGLAASFTVFTLAAASLLDALGLPQDLLRNLAIGLLFVVAATLVSTRIAHLVERPLHVLTRRRPGDLGGGFVLGLGLGLVFVPRGAGARGDHGPGRQPRRGRRDGGPDAGLRARRERAAARDRRRRPPRLGAATARMPWLRPVRGGVVALSALAIALGADRSFQTALPGYIEAFQERVERSAAADRELSQLTGAAGPGQDSADRLADYGPAPDFAGVAGWLNTPPLSLERYEARSS